MAEKSLGPFNGIGVIVMEATIDVIMVEKVTITNFVFIWVEVHHSETFIAGKISGR